jgi:hypothetical protein
MKMWRIVLPPANRDHHPVEARYQRCSVGPLRREVPPT